VRLYRKHGRRSDRDCLIHSSTRHPHHAPDGGFRNPWPELDNERHGAAFLRWRWQRLRDGSIPGPPHPAALPIAAHGIAAPQAAASELRITWVGHATFLVQIGAFNLLTDPVWSERVSPVPWAGPRRLVAPAAPFDALPPIDAVLLSHDHYDHLDSPTVRRLHARFGDRLRWITPLGYSKWFGARGVHNIVELDWGDTTAVGAGQARVSVSAAPARHWTRRRPFGRSRRLWASFAIDGANAGSVYFGGDSGWFPGYPDIRRAHGPFDAVILPIGAYEPRWFMKAMHMSPDEAVQAYRELGSTGTFLPMHWGTFMLADEPPLEPPALLRQAWTRAGLSDADLRVLRHGETFVRPPRSADPLDELAADRPTTEDRTTT
jgi:N-acyl-phosphatidylethanolamine-hydrolysing phospholipase D